MIYVLDTHSITWFVENDPRLSSAARQVIGNSANSFVVPAMVLVEVKYLNAKGRINTDLPRLYQQFINLNKCLVHPLDEQIVSLIPVDLDIHDSVIVATAIFYRDILQQPTTLITKDTKITQSGLIQTLW